MFKEDLNKYSVVNALVISATYPNATQIKEFDDWKESGCIYKERCKWY